jgi:hypothetical protein
MADHDDLELPSHWTPSARDAFENVLAERPGISGADWAALEQAAELITAADTLEAAAREAGPLIPGSQGQMVLNPAISEARLARTAAAQILSRLTAGGKAGALTNSERGRMAANARWAKRA